MKARITQHCKNGFYYGEVYDSKYKYWETVTLGCLTIWGAKRELMKYKKTKCPKEFEL